MQSLQDIPDTTTLTESRQMLLNNILTALSSSSDVVFPTTNLQEGMFCYRTDVSILYLLKDLTPTWAAVIDLSGTAALVALATSLNGGAAGTIPYQSAAGVTEQLAAGTAGMVLKSNGAGAPVWILQSALAGVASAAQATNATNVNGGTVNATTGVFSGALTINGVANQGFPTGTRMAFNQTAAPLGWTKDTTAALNNSALRIVTGTVGSGGTVAFTTAFASKAVAGTISSVASSGAADARTLTVAMLPSHTHSVGSSFDVAGTTSGANYAAGNTTTATSGASGSGSSHGHTLTMTAHSHTLAGTAIDLAVKYNDFIIATKAA